jgi:4-azaleucine resistance transporter AzlC
MQNELTFRQGLRDALPISLGYISVSFAFGMIAIVHGLPVWAPTVISMTSITGTGQFVGADLMGAAASVAEIVCTLVIINARYFLMSLSLTQRLPNNVTLWQRLIIAFGNTDEIFAVSMCQTKPLNFRYFGGLILCAYSGWAGGTLLGSFANNIIPKSLLSALGIALYAMFTALIIPPAKKEYKIAAAVTFSVAISCLLYYMPVLRDIGGGWIIIISGVAAAAAAAVIFPRKADE